MSEAQKSELRVLFDNLAANAERFFETAAKECEGHNDDLWENRSNKYYFWEILSNEAREPIANIETRLLKYCAELVTKVRRATLTGDEDQRDLREATKAMRAALRLRRYTLHGLQVINDEDVVLGIRQAEQSDDECSHPNAASSTFMEQLRRVESILKLVEASGDLDSLPGVTESAAAAKYRPGTAFILMWMDSSQPDLNDVVDAVKSVFHSLGVRAIRADDIEHEGLITQRILDEISTSEFLFADLTGARPNVYYEVGYAHALGKRVVLYRKSGTGIHFDLAGYNCPEYESLRDLREKLTKRLVSITNRNPSD